MRTMNNNLVALCTLLSDLDYHDGTSLGQSLGMTRTAVWKLIKKLQHYGVDIKADKVRGYALATPLHLLNHAIISAGLTDPSWHIDIFEAIPSTNDFLNQHHTSDQQICLAEYQTAGRGRLGRSWHSPFAQNINMSFSYLFTKDISDLGGLSLAVALLTCQAIESLYALPKPISLKWPNDLYYDNKKMGGILVDLQAETHGHCRVVVGIGLNINTEVAKQTELQRPWTSLQQITGKLSDRNALVIALMNQLSTGLAEYQAAGFSPFIEAWEMRDHLRDKAIQLQWLNRTVQGVAAGINLQGHLVVRLEDGTVKHFSSGEASLHGSHTSGLNHGSL